MVRPADLAHPPLALPSLGIMPTPACAARALEPHASALSVFDARPTAESNPKRSLSFLLNAGTAALANGDGAASVQRGMHAGALGQVGVHTNGLGRMQMHANEGGVPPGVLPHALLPRFALPMQALAPRPAAGYLSPGFSFRGDAIFSPPVQLPRTVPAAGAHAGRDTSPVDDLLLAAGILSGAVATPSPAPPVSAAPIFAPALAPSLAPSLARPLAPAYAASVPSLPPTAVVTKRAPRRGGRVSCDVCGRQFGEAAAVRKHRRVVHDKVKEFGCDHCGRRFAEKSNLKKHIIARHGGRREHRCKQCSKTFNFSDGLRRHVNNTHLGLRPYQCEDCPSKFKQRTHLQKHRASVHPPGGRS